MRLADYYRLHGESDALADLEAAVDDRWRSTAELALRAGRSRSYARPALGYLLEEGRVEVRRRGLWPHAAGYRLEWRLPAGAR